MWDPKKDALGDGAAGASVDSLMAQLEGTDSGMSGGMPIVRPGDASVAAPFTSRVPSIRAVVDLIRQGHSLTLTHSLTHSLTHLLTHSLTYSLTHSLRSLYFIISINATANHDVRVHYCCLHIVIAVIA